MNAPRGEAREPRRKAVLGWLLQGRIIMRLSTIGLIGYVLFLGVYVFVKYSAAAPPQFSAAYAQNVAILVAMTGVAPFLLCLGAARLIPGGTPVRLSALAIVGVVLGVAAYALFFVIFIQGAAPGADIVDVARRGVGWGALQGILAALAATRVRA